MDSLTAIDWGSVLLKVVSAVLILIVTFVLALVVKYVVEKLFQKIPALQRFGNEGQKLGGTIGSVASLIIWLLGLIAVLGVFGLDGVLAPVTSMLDTGLSYLPNIIGATFVLIIGLVIARIARVLVTTVLQAANLEKRFADLRNASTKIPGGAPAAAAPAQPTRPEQTAAVPPQPGSPSQQGSPAPAPAGQAQPQAQSTIATTLGNVTYGVIVVVVAIAAVQILGIQSISDPATQMLNVILGALPNVIAAGLVLFLGVVVARFAAGLLEDVLGGVGLDSSLKKADLLPEDKSVVPTISKIVLVAIVLFFGVIAAELLGFPRITELLSEILALGGNIIFGALIIAAGFFLATFIAKFLSGQAATIVKYVTIVLFVAIGLKSMGVADSIIEIGFSALVVGAALAAVLAFGLGGRDAAARTLEKLEKKAEAAETSAPVAPASTPSHAAEPRGDI
jgi:MFS family permease